VGEIQINYFAVLAAGVFSYLLGTIWYSPKLFAKHWKEAVGKTENEIRMSLKPVIYVITFVCWIIASYVLAVFVHYSKAELSVMECLQDFYAGSDLLRALVSS